MSPEAREDDGSSGAADLPLERLAGHLEQQGLDAIDLTARLIGGGRSNLTYLVSAGTADSRSTWVLRRPPLGHVLATAHDMGREFRVISALHETEVPVPRPVYMCTDQDIIGSPFYIMDHVEGDVIRTDDAVIALGEDAGVTGHSLVKVLSCLHALDPASVGLADFGWPAGFMERQVRRWTAQLDASRSRDLDGIDELSTALAGAVPVHSDTAIIHGDYRLDNCLIHDRRVAAVLDWEMATIGDPLADLALFAVYTGGFSQIGTEVIHSPAGVGSFPTAQTLVDDYLAATGRNVDQVGWYLGFAWFKLAVILEGIHYRSTLGKSIGDEFVGVDAIVPQAIERGRAALAETGWSV